MNNADLFQDSPRKVEEDDCQEVNKTQLGRVDKNASVFPGSSLILHVDCNFSSGDELLIEPRFLSRTYAQTQWPQPQIAIVAKNGGISLQNNTSDIIPVYKNDHPCQIYKTKPIEIRKVSEITPKPSVPIIPSRPFSKYVHLDPQDRLDPDLKRAFLELHERYDQVFEPVIGRYNDNSG